MEEGATITVTDEPVEFDFDTEKSSRIKIVGVGGGGCNAVTHMYNEGIDGVDFVLINTDLPALEKSPVPHKLVIGMSITNGRGTGDRPDVAEQCALSSESDIRALFDAETDMVFIAAGMGGGTGTGSSPVVAKIAKEMNKLTVGIVTIPYFFERPNKIIQALEGVERLSENVDALIVISNQKLLEAFPGRTVLESFIEADNTLLTAAKSISDIINQNEYINIDFNDVNTTLRDGGVAVISHGESSGVNRMTKAIEIATTSPLLNNNNLYDAKKVLVVVQQSRAHGAANEEFAVELYAFMNRFPNDVHVIWGIGIDETLDENIRVTVLASGFSLEDVPLMDRKRAGDLERMGEDERFALEEARAARERDDRERTLLITKYYGQDAVAGILGKTAPKPYIFKADELDDDSVIDRLLNIPAYKRR
ncbi:MAG: cell division protein FtsZ [Dysgonamonadaceae bacterium]|jgi:cell division protein FtsZ|nr:cell division protein FtsZ [Dysgonamonadaceae bacterium]